MNKQDQLRSLKRVCRRFGGRLAIISQRYFDRLFTLHRGDVCESPFTSAHGIHWGKKVVYAVRGREEVGSLIHEMGHVFADHRHPDSSRCREFRWFGWEVALARQIDAYRVWSHQNGDYATNDAGRTWGMLSATERRAVALERLAFAKKIRVVGPDGAPRSVR